MIGPPPLLESTSMKYSQILTLGPLLLLAVVLGGCAMPGLPDRPTTIEKFMTVGERPRVIAHRGFSGVAPENTMAAFRRAYDIRADMIELDVLLSRDGQVVVIHDDTLDRTTNTRGPVADLTWDELRTLDAGSWFAPEFEGEPIPLLRDVLAWAKGKILVNVEIKTEAYSPNVLESISAKVVTIVDEVGMRDQVVVSSFDSRILKQIRALDPDLKTATLYYADVHGELRPIVITANDGSNGFNLGKTEVNARVVEECHAEGIPVAVYTVNTREMMVYVLGLGVDAIFTNHPDVLIDLLLGRPATPAEPPAPDLPEAPNPPKGSIDYKPPS